MLATRVVISRSSRSQCQRFIWNQPCNSGRRNPFQITRTRFIPRECTTCYLSKRLSSSSSKSNKDHPFARFNQKQSKDESNAGTNDSGIHPYKRLIQKRRDKDDAKNTTKSPLVRVLEQYERSNEKNVNRNKRNESTPSSALPSSNSANATASTTNTSSNITSQTTSSSSSTSISEESIEYTVNLLSKCTLISEKLMHKQSTIPPSPLHWLLDATTTSKTLQDQNHSEEEQIIFQQRVNQYKNFNKLLQIILQESFTKQLSNLIASSTMHNVKTLESLNRLLTNCLVICSNSLPPRYWNDATLIAATPSSRTRTDDDDDNTDNDHMDEFMLDKRTIDTPMQNCMKIYHLLKKYNLDIQPIHYESIIKTANFNHFDDINDHINNQEGDSNFEFASKIFKKQINIDESGYVPIDSRLGWDSCVEMGLYSIAMNTLNNANIDDGNHNDERERNNDGNDDVAKQVGEEVMSAVEEMCLVSPTDQERYILAAGSAIGRAGQYLALIQYIQNHSEMSSKFGQALIAAAMGACVQCGQYELGLSLYYDLGNDPSSSEWQWAGGYGTIHPLCRDLALQCMGMVRHEDQATNSGYSETATKILKQIIEEDGHVSQKALVSVFHTFESDGDVERALKLMHLILLYRKEQMDWKIVGDSLENFMVDSVSQNIIESDKNGLSNETLLTLTMDTCNSAGEFGLTVLLCQLGLSNNFMNMNSNHFDNETISINTLFESQPLLSTNDEILAATMFALCCLGRQCDAISLYDKATAKGEIKDGVWDYSNECLTHASSLGQNQLKDWDETYQHMNRVIFAMKYAETTKETISKEEEYLIPLAVAEMLRNSLKAGQPRAGLYLAKSAAATIAKTQKSSSKSIKETIQSFLGFRGRQSNSLIVDDIASVRDFLSCSDEILSATMEAYKEIGELDEALLMFLNKWENDSTMRKSVRSAPFHPDPDRPDRKWINSCDLALDIFIKQNRFESAFAFFKAMLPSYRSERSYLIIAKSFAKAKKWDEVARLYNNSIEIGCLSNEMAVLAMEGIVHGTIDGKMKILRSIVDDIASSKQIKSGAWIFDNYWELKRRLGFHHARLLMWWNDPTKTQEEELRIAIQHFEESRAGKRKLDPDVPACIIKLSSHKHTKMYRDDLETEEALNSQREAAEMIINTIYRSFELNERIDRSSTIFEGLSALKNLGAYKYFIDFVVDLIDQGQGLHVSSHILSIAKDIAIEEGDSKALDRIESVLLDGN